MTKRFPKARWSHAFTRVLNKMTMTAARAGSRVVVKTLTATSKAPKRKPAKPRPIAKANWSSGVTIGATGARRYYLYKPPDVRRNEYLPLMVMLHGCGQDAEALAASTRMNRIAAAKRFIVLYPEQERLSNAQGCWNWFDTRSGRAQREADSIDAMINQICLSHPIDRQRIVLAGLSAGASMAALMAVRCPGRFRVVAMHSGITTGVAYSSATAFMTMRGRKVAAKPFPIGIQLPALLVIHGSSDQVVAPANGAQAAYQWATLWNAKPSKPRNVRRGARYATTITDYRTENQLVVTFCEVDGLDHAWSGGASGQVYSDPKGPDASGMIWAFANKQFTSRA